MAWVRHNVSKSKLQHNAFFKVANQPVQIETKDEIINPRKPIDVFSNNISTINEYDYNSCMKHIDAILYISYDKHKEDSIINEIKKIDPKLSRTLKITADKNTIAALGTTQSHILALQEFIKNTAWKTCLILEDDFTFNNTNSVLVNSTLNYFINAVPNFDMLLLAANKNDSDFEDTDFPFINKILSTSNKSAYIITRKYLFKLIGNLIKNSILIKKEGFKEEYAMENFWEKLCRVDNWYALAESDISN